MSQAKTLTSASLLSFPPLLNASMCTFRKMEDSIQEEWRRSHSNPILKHDIAEETKDRVVVGLSVLSLLDLYLLSKSYPPGSEVIITPPITIEGMVRVFQYHQLDVKPLDILWFEDDKNPTIDIDLEVIQDAITEKTVTIMVVHLFGLVCTLQNEMKYLRDLVQVV